MSDWEMNAFEKKIYDKLNKMDTPFDEEAWIKMKKKLESSKEPSSWWLKGFYILLCLEYIRESKN